MTFDEEVANKDLIIPDENKVRNKYDPFSEKDAIFLASHTLNN